MLLKLIKSLVRQIKLKINPIALAESEGVLFGKDCRLVGKVSFGSEPYLIKLGNHVSITESSFITHDGGVWVLRSLDPDIDVIAPIIIGNNVFIGSGCIILPGTIIEDNVIVGAGSIVRGRLEADSVYAGVPVKFIKSLTDYREKAERISLSSKRMNNRDKRKYLEKLFEEILKGDR